MLWRYMRKVLLLHLSLFWMKKLENFSQWSRFAAITQIECVDHVAMLGCFKVRLWADCAAFFKNLVVSDAVMYLNCKGLSWSGWIPHGSSRLACNKLACWSIQMAPATGQSWGLVATQKKEIFTPFCLFFCVPPNVH